ncbi:restriction endonuclease subunit S [Lactobacillus crispatus]|uniref:restriction endonuclease subunit S n=1 Tax=Lactobacillus crispatus TaxID=47770 RepID=UPI001667B55C|nr:restriction endonuclease subunit S [Lactobacillus crispatus]MBD0967870.1 restriction endonuclease subunit S [Lactobacillus crispatus]
MLIQKFTTLFKDVTRQGTKIPKEEYLTHGKNIIIDQGQDIVAGYTNCEDGIFKKIPAIVFGDHTRIIKYVDTPFFLGADGVKVLKCTDKNANYRYLYYALKNAHIPNTGYNRHFKWLKEITINYPDKNKQNDIVNILDKLEYIIKIRSQELDKFDELIKARFVEMFGDPVQNSLNKPMVKLESLGDWKSGGTPARSNPNFYDGNINWFSAGELDSLYLSKSKEKITDEAVRKSSTKLFAKGSMLIGMYDTAAFKMGILKEPSCANQACANIRANEKVNVIWLYYELQAMKKYFLNQRHGVRQKNLTLKMIKQFEIPYFDLSLQNKFANFVQQVNKSKFENIVYLNKTLSMKILGQLGDVFRD